MNAQLEHYKEQIKGAWSSFSNKQKITMGISFLIILISLILLVYWASKPDFVPIYQNLSPSESGEIVNEIEARGIPVKLSSDGREVSVPKADASRLKVEMAHAGIPRSGNVNYGIFSENMGFGMTDKQFDVIERDAMQNEIRYLIEQIDGVQSARVMITLPREKLWVADDRQLASASIVIHTRPGLDLNQTQINGLYHLISRSVPNLPVENIVIMNQNWHTYDLMDAEQVNTTLSVHQQHREVRRDIEKDIQRELQSMLGMILGMDSVVVSVMANVDFSQERREEHLVQPVVDNEGIAISVERIQESFSGQGANPGGIGGTGDTDIAGYQGVDTGGESEYESLEERINNEVNRIYRQIDSSPYVIEDLTINVGLDLGNFTDEDGNRNEAEAQAIIDNVNNIVTSVVSTSLRSANRDRAEQYPEEDIANKINVFELAFQGRPEFEEPQKGMLNGLVIALIAALVLAIGGIGFVVVRQRKQQALERENEEAMLQNKALLESEEDLDIDMPEQKKTHKQIEKLAKSQPEEFAKLLRTWMSED